MTRPAAALLLLLAGAARAAELSHHVLALSWQPAFCETRPENAECRAQTPERWDATRPALHGLWPDAGGGSLAYCGVPDELRRRRWCDLPESPLSPATRAGLSRIMPGSASCLDRYQWHKHGSCSGRAPEDYFALAVALTDKAAETRLARRLASSAGKRVDTAELLDLFTEEFGERAASSLALICRGDALFELRLFLKPSLSPADPLGAALLAHKRRGSNCPASVRITAAPAR